MMDHEFVARAQWKAAPPRAPIPPASYPEQYAILHHEGAGRAPSDDRAAEAAYMRRLQQTMFGRGYADIAYSAVVMPSGRVYEGRDLRLEDAATAGVSATSLSVMWPGNHELIGPTLQQVAGTAWLIRLARWTGRLMPDAVVHPHRWAVPSTVCPGRHAVAAIPTIMRLVDSPSAPAAVEVRPMYDPPIPPVVASAPDPATDHGVWLLSADGAVYAIHGARYAGGANGKPYFQGRRAARIEPGPAPKIYTIVATSGERYTYPE